MNGQHITQSDRYIISTEKFLSSFGNKCVRAYDRVLEDFVNLPLVVVSAGSGASVATVYTGTQCYQPLTCALYGKDEISFFTKTLLGNLDKTHTTERWAGVITKVRKAK